MLLWKPETEATNQNQMAALNLSYSSSSSSYVTSSRHLSIPRFLSSQTKSTLPFPYADAFSLRNQALVSSTRPRSPAISAAAAMAAGGVRAVHPPALDSTSEPPTLFDGTTRLYISYTCPYAQRVWITRNCKGLQEKIKLVPIDLQNRPAWYKEKVYPANKVPSLEHNNEVIGESLDLIKYIDDNFEGPSLLPDDPAKRQFAEELLAYTDSFSKGVMTLLKGQGVDEASAVFDYIEMALSKFEDGPFFLGQFSLVDIAYAPFIERYVPFLREVRNYDAMAGRPKLAAWFEEMCKIEGYEQTRSDPKQLLEAYKIRFAAHL